MAFPIAWYAMNSWLKDFAYRVNIQWWVIYRGWFTGGADRICNRKFPGDKSGIGESR
ncbi:MAG: hypothetical protein WDO19_28050 [Bacteroidota bacterium]